jgi:septal ring factor EnvC (AmiA/AmiB activator)
MDNEQFERQMSFIVEQQAKFSADLGARDAQWKARDTQWEARMKKVDRQIKQLVRSMGILRDAVIGLTHHVERHDQKIVEIDRGLQELVERGKETDARLNALLLVVERHISGHQ